MTNSFSPFYFLRHGATNWNQEHRAMGQTDIPLNAVGQEQAREAALCLQDYEFTSIVASPLSRALETAKIISKSTPRSTPISLMDDLKEARWGVLEGELKGDGTLMQAWRKGEEIKGAESFQDFKSRVIRGFLSIMTCKGPVLIVSHGGVYWVLQEMLHLPQEGLANCVPVYHRPPEKKDDPWFVCSLEEDVRVLK